MAGLGQKYIGSHAKLVWLVLLLYSIYSVTLYAFVRGLVDARPRRIWHWIDVGCCVVVVVLSGGGSVFAAFFVFPILASSFRWGLAEGLRVSTVAVASWVGAELVEVAGRGGWNEGGWILTEGALLLAAAYVVARCIDLERQSRARLELLAEINRVPNARFGPDRVIGGALERLRDFYQADTCLAVISSEESPPRILVAEKDRYGAALEGPTASVLVENLLSLPDGCEVACNSPTRLSLFRTARVYVGGTQEPDQTDAAEKCSRDLSRFLDAGSWLSVPLEMTGGTAGRLYIMSQRTRFDACDIVFLREAAEKLMPLVETVQLLDGLASEAANKERTKISLDLHDSTIQPYLGLKLGLESLCRRMGSGNPLAADLVDLCRMTNESIAELRGYVRDLKAQPAERSCSLLENVQRQADRFSELYGIDVELNGSLGLTLNDRLTAEVLQIIGEGLSNVGRHTDSRSVTINLSRRGEHLLVQIVNHGGESGGDWKPFRPKSIAQRATQLGGSTEVSPQPDGGSAVTVDIPL